MNDVIFFIGYVLSVFVCALFAFYCGWRAADSYWKKRIDERPESIAFKNKNAP